MPQNPYELTTFGNSLLLRVDGAIGAMSLLPNGRDAVLAGRRGLFIIDLDDPFTTPRWLHHITLWEVADVQWLPHHHAKLLWCISTSNQKALLWDLARPSKNAILNVLHKHTRAITDINFHPLDPEVLATCSVDTFIFSWDMRLPRRPVAQWAEWRAGATQVKWNHHNPFEVASAHDSTLYVWDTRKGALPLVRVEKAHGGKINGLDFSGGMGAVVTCLNDHQIRLWDLGMPESGPVKPRVVLRTEFPVSRARPLPFGRDRAVGIMPLRGGDDSIHIVNYENALQRAAESGTTQFVDADPVHSFKGHNGAIKDFLWRTRHEAYAEQESTRPWRDYQLVTWLSLDYDLKLWAHDDELYRQVNYNPSHQKILDEFSPDTDSDRPISPAVRPCHYQTYCTEPTVAVADLKAENNGDLLLLLARYQLAQNHRDHATTELNHLDWILGVRLGHSSKVGEPLDDGPSNLGEEVSIVGHKFPKIRFEKISVSTGHLVMSLRGPKPSIDVPEVKEKEKEDAGEPKTAANIPKLGPTSTQTTTEPLPPTTAATGNTAPSNAPVATSTAGISTNIASTVVPTTSIPNTSSATNTSTANNATVATPTHKESISTEVTVDEEPILVFIRLLVRFPLNYPYSEAPESSKRAQELVKFSIEETHELTAGVKAEMLRNLNAIADFYTNKYHKFCLEPCLRYLMGDKIDLDDSDMVENAENDEDDVYIQEVGTEGWADDLIRQQPGFAASLDDGLHEDLYEDDEDDDDADLIPLNDDMAHSAELSIGPIGPVGGKMGPEKPFFDSTPVPKGCGAVWLHAGQLVCFFMPKESVADATRGPSVLRFSGGGFGLKSGTHHRQSPSEASLIGLYASGSASDDSESGSGEDSDNNSDDSYANDWDDMARDDVFLRVRIPGLFKTSLGLGGRHVLSSNNRSLGNRMPSQTSNYKSSNADEKKKRRLVTLNVVTIFDFRHLVPDKYELACEYRLLGDSPDRLARYNAQVALNHGLVDISNVWSVLEAVLVKDTFENTAVPPAGPRGRFFWGRHPYGHSWLVQELFAYFEARENVQMLAMMACILFENTALLLHSPSVPIHTPYQALPPPLSVVLREPRPSYARYDSNTSKLTPRGMETRFSNASLAPLMPSYGAQYARSVTSSLDAISARGSPDRFGLKKSGETVPHQPEPPSLRNKGIKKQRPVLQRKPPPPQPARTRPRAPPTVSIDMKNEETLDLHEDVYSQALLSSQPDAKIQAYREHYADMLYSWGLMVARIKVLKFNYPSAGLHHFDLHRTAIGLRKPEVSPLDHNPLVPRTPITTVRANVWNSETRAVGSCSLCALEVTKRVVVCTRCEHVLHFDCASDWWDSSDECPSGCGCHCLEDSF